MRLVIWSMLIGTNLAYAEADATKGEALYMASCTACHGKNADGQGPAGPALSPKPTDFTSGLWWTDRSDQEVKANIKNGKPGTAMMAFAHLGDEDIDNIVAFLRTKQPTP